MLSSAKAFPKNYILAFEHVSGQFLVVLLWEPSPHLTYLTGELLRVSAVVPRCRQSTGESSLLSSSPP